MHASPQFLFQGPQLGLLPLAHRLSQDREVPLPGPSANVREAQEVERLRLAFATLPPILFRKAAKFDDACLIGMQLKAKLRESIAQLRQELLCFIPMLESSHEVIGKANEDDFSARMPLSPLSDPEVECVMKIDIRQQRANTATLNCPYLAFHPFALFQHAGFEPFLNQAHDAPIGYAVLDKFHQPPLIESVIKLPDVGIEHPSHFSRSDPYRQRVQSLMWTATGPESIRESQEVLFVDRVQHLDGGTLDDLIFQRGNTERPKLTRFTHLRDVHPAHRSCSVGSSLESMSEILKVGLKVLTIVLPRLSVHACGSVLLNRKERCPQSIDVVNVVEERSELLFPISTCCLTYPLERAGRVSPALSPERVTFGRVPLGQPPSLHRFRCRSLGIVRRLRRYFGAVRLPTSVRHRRTSFDFPTRSAVLSPADRRGISRFPRKVVPCMLGVSDRAESRPTLR
jgi:hypothetical protein